jgi:hypothetical protein
MGRFLLNVMKTVVSVVVIAGTVIASFYFAYLLLVILFVCILGGITWLIFNWDDIVTEWWEDE